MDYPALPPHTLTDVSVMEDELGIPIVAVPKTPRPVTRTPADPRSGTACGVSSSCCSWRRAHVVRGKADIDRQPQVHDVCKTCAVVAYA
jgi:hypothetical protein